jgi:class 3 adenylate cyclase
MVFVNKIADIVHTICDKHLGAANKNIGDAFLLVWKLPHWARRQHLDDMQMSILITSMNDLALICFLKIFAEINRNHMLIEYVENQAIHKRVGQGYKVRMGFGLHYGWAIEGSIGSHHKIDVSYLSPNVNMSARLEAATKQYGVPILLSGEFIDLLSPAL